MRALFSSKSAGSLLVLSRSVCVKLVRMPAPTETAGASAANAADSGVANMSADNPARLNSHRMNDSPTIVVAGRGNAKRRIEHAVWAISRTGGYADRRIARARVIARGAYARMTHFPRA